MHFFFITRGEKDCVRRFANEFAALRLQWTGKDKKGKTVKMIAPTTLQPIQLWSVTFPKENLDLILASLNPTTSSYDGKMKLPLAALRKMLGAQKVPECKDKSRVFPIYRKHTQILAIGIKDDVENVFGNEML